MDHSQIRSGIPPFPSRKQLSRAVLTNRRRNRRKGRNQGSQGSPAGPRRLLEGVADRVSYAVLAKRSFQPVPDRKIIYFLYADQQSITDPNNGNVATKKIAVNSPDDPDQGGTGDQQPYGWGFWSGAYANYICTGAHVAVEFYDSTGDGFVVGYQVGGTDPSGQPDYHVDSRVGIRSQTMSNTGEQSSKFEITIKPWDVIGVTRAQYMDNTPTYGAAVGSSPSALVSMWVWAVNSIGSSVKYRLRIVYTVEMFNRVQLSATTHA